MRSAFVRALLPARQPFAGLGIHIFALLLTLSWLGWMAWLSLQPVDQCERLPGLQAISGTLPLHASPPCCSAVQADPQTTHIDTSAPSI